MANLNQDATKNSHGQSTVRTAAHAPAALPALVIGDLTVRVPIVQGGMGVGVSMAGLASAVARAGGLGVISAVGLGYSEPDLKSNYLAANIRALRKQIQAAQAQAGGGALGVNIMVALTDYGTYAKVAAEEGIDVIFSGAGLPMNLPEYMPPGATTKLVPIISSYRAAVLLCKKWLARYNRLPDGFVLEGPLAGGHLGFQPAMIDDPDYQLPKLLTEVLDAVKPYAEAAGKPLPVIAAGGIFDGQDIKEYLRLGAAGVQLGTRFVATDECDASLAFKEAYVKSLPEDVVIMQSPVGMPGRAIRSNFTEALKDGRKRPVQCPYKCIVTCQAENSPYCIALALLNARTGNFEHGFAFAGANVWRVTDIVPVQTLMDSLVAEACR